MEILAIGFIIYVVFLFMRKPIKEEIEVIEVKKCPQHSWSWQDIIDQDGNKQGERIVCKDCGPLSKSLDGSVE